MLYIIYHTSSWWNYIIGDFKGNSNIFSLGIEMSSSFFIRIIRRGLGIFNIYPSELYYPRKMFKRLNSIHSGDRLLVMNIDITNLDILNIIIKHIPARVKIYYWLSNPCRKIFAREECVMKTLHNIKKLGITLCTYDTFDAKQYNLVLLNQLYRYPKIIKESVIEYDFYFLGNPKDRIEKIKYVRDKLLKHFFSINFLIINKTTEQISYEQNIVNILKSKCIVDIVQQDQKGLTLRPLESIFFKKKLLTDYMDIATYDFYNPQNIFIVGIDNWENIHSFLSTPYLPIEREIIDSYDVNRWVRNFLKVQ